MIWKKISLCMSVLILLTLFSVSHAAATVQLTVTAVGGNVFILQGNSLEGIAVLDFEFGYDPTVISNPKGSPGGLIPSDAIFNFNPSTPGQIRLFIRIGARAVNGSGTLATIRFDGVDNAVGAIQSLTANLVTVRATPVLADVRIVNQLLPPVIPPLVAEGVAPVIPTAVQPVTPVIAPPAVVTPITSTVVSSGVTLGSVTMPGDRIGTEKVLQDKKDVPATVPAVNEPQPTRPSPPPDFPPERVEPSTKSPPPLKELVYQSVLHRMKAYRGARIPAELMELFKPVVDQKVRQEPLVALTDGKSTVSLRVDLPSTLKETPNFSFRNASVVSLEQSADGSWMIVLLPQKNAFEVRMSARFEGGLLVYPLVVAPPIDPALLALNGSLEDVFALFLKPPGAALDSRFDLNGDGKFDYVDDYIFTANYLAAQQKSLLKRAKDKKK